MTYDTNQSTPREQRWRESVNSETGASKRPRAPKRAGAALLHRQHEAADGDGGDERALLESLDSGFCIIEVEFDEAGQPVDYRFLKVNRAFERQTGLTDAVGRRMRELAPDHEAHWFDIYGRIALTGEPERFERPADALGRYYEVYAFRVGAPEERKVAILFSDISERKRQEDERELLLRELSHRMKNTLAVVTALARQTGVTERSAEEYRDAFLGRLNALSAVHSLLLEKDWLGADLTALAARTLAPYTGEPGAAGTSSRISLDGPSLALSPGQGLALGLLLHELATNAMKYGALSSPEGRLTLSWRVTEGPAGRCVELLWRETGGPPVPAQRGSGFGSRLIERLARAELGSAVELDYRPEGLVCRLVFRAG